MTRNPNPVRTQCPGRFVSLPIEAIRDFFTTRPIARPSDWPEIAEYKPLPTRRQWALSVWIAGYLAARGIDIYAEVANVSD